MIANSEDTGTLARTMGRLTIGVGLAATAGIILTATAAPVRLVGVTSEGDTVLIEATEPVAYSVSRPDALTLVVDMRNVSVSDARADVERQGPIAGVRLEQASASDGRALARVHVTLAKPSEYLVRSARNTIRVELKEAQRPRRPPWPRRSQRRRHRRAGGPDCRPPAAAVARRSRQRRKSHCGGREERRIRLADRRRSSSASSRARRQAPRP